MLTELISCHDEIVDLCVRFRVRSLVAFGSATGDEFDPGRSDVDFLVEFDAPHGMRRIDAYFGLKEGLEHLFGRRVDLVAPSALENPYFAEAVDRSRMDLYAA